MRFAWTLEASPFPPDSVRVLRSATWSEDTLSDLQKKTIHARMPTSLKSYVLAVLDEYSRTRSGISRQALVEFVAAFDFCHQNRDAGRLTKLTQVCNRNYEAKAHATRHLRHWCDECIQRQTYERNNFWFLFRIAIMDAYTIAHIFASTSLCIFYGGDSHVQNVRDYLTRYAHARVAPIPPRIANLCFGKGLMTVAAFFVGERHIVLLGEDHLRTKRNFGVSLVTFLQSMCNVATEQITCLVEKHISNKQDPLQMELTCNMPHMAIHRFRCDRFLEEHQCRNLHIVSVDNRHVDLGFLRLEVFLPTERSSECAKQAVLFHRDALKSLQDYLDRL